MAAEKSSTVPETGEQILSSFSSLDDIDDALLVEILASGLLNYKVAFQCKLMCKRWQNLISSPIFVSLWKKLRGGEPLPFVLFINLRFIPSRRFPQDNYVFNHIISQPRLGLNLDFLPCPNPGLATSVRIAASCKELLLCYSIGQSMDLESRVYYICNPVTKHWIALPPFPSNYRSMKCTVGMVIGEKSFQVVRLNSNFEERGSSNLIAEIFSSETNRWDEIEITEPYNLIREEMSFSISSSEVSDNMFSWNGILFIDKNGSNGSIIAYNPLEPERCHILHNPNRNILTERRGRVDSMAFVDCNGSLRVLQLCYIHGYHITGNGCFRIWELEDYKNGEWSLKNEVFFGELITDDADLLRKFNNDSPELCLRVLALDSNDKDTIYFCCVVGKSDASKRIFSCNLRTKEVELFDSSIQESTDGHYYIIRDVFQIAAPKWPTPVPLLPKPSFVDR